MLGATRQIGRLRHLYPVWLGPVRLKDGARIRAPALQLGLPIEAPPRALPVLDEVSRGTRFLSLPVRRVLNPPASTHMGFWSINPYVGCEFGCSYCYARRTHEWTLERATGLPGIEPAHESFERNILIKHAAPEVLLRTLEPGKLGTTPLVIGTATDPYQPAEKKFGLTRRLLQALLHHRGLHIGIITKSPLVVRDLDVLRELASRHRLSVNISIGSMDPEMLRCLEARTPAPHARMRALKRLVDGGIDAGVLIAPILPGITDGWAQLAQLMEAAREAGAHWVAGQALRLGPAARAGFLPLLREKFPELIERYEKRYGKSQRAGVDYERALSKRLAALKEAFGFPPRLMYSESS
jgi:DNA repair photolyase